MLKVLAVTVNNHNITYDRYGDNILCDYDASNTLTVDYIFRAAENTWNGDFTLGIEFELASLFGASLRADEKLLAGFSDKAAFQLKMARTNDSQQQTTRKLRTGRFVANRRG